MQCILLNIFLVGEYSITLSKVTSSESFESES